MTTQKFRHYDYGTADHGQPDDVTEEYYEFVESYRDEAVSDLFIANAWEARLARRAETRARGFDASNFNWGK